MNWIARFLSPEKKAMLELAQRILASLDTDEERKAAAAFVWEKLEDGKVPPIEWAGIGKALGVFRGPREPDIAA